MDTTRASLLIRVRDRNDSTAWKEFHELYSRLITSYARMRGLTEADAADITSDCIHLLVEKMPEFDYDRSKGRFRGWLRTVVNNKITDLMRKKKPDLANTHALRQARDRGLQPDELWEKTWEQAHLAHCMTQVQAEVAKEHFEAFRLYAVEQWSVERVAKHLKLSENQVYLAKSRVTARLKEAMSALLGKTDN